MKYINLWLSVMIFLLALFVVIMLSGKVFATPELKCLCHNANHNPHEVCSSDNSYKQGHELHLMTGFDKYGRCPNPTVTPTRTPTPTKTPTPTRTPTVTPTSIPTVTPEPTKEPEATPTMAPGGWSPEPEGNRSTTNPPQCGEGAVVRGVENFHLYRNGDRAILKWFPTEGNEVNIYYKQVSSNDWQYSVRNVPNNGYYEISGLGTLDVSFAVQQVNSCSGGVSVMGKTIIDGAESAWVLFR